MPPPLRAIAEPRGGGAALGAGNPGLLPAREPATPPRWRREEGLLGWGHVPALRGPGRSHPRPSYSRRAASGVDTASGAADGGGRGEADGPLPGQTLLLLEFRPQRARSPLPSPSSRPRRAHPASPHLPAFLCDHRLGAGRQEPRSVAQARPGGLSSLPPSLGTDSRAATGGTTTLGPAVKARGSSATWEALGGQGSRNNLLCCSPLCPQHHDIRSHPVDSGSPGFLGLSPPRRDLRNEAQTEGSKGWRALP